MGIGVAAYAVVFLEDMDFMSCGLQSPCGCKATTARADDGYSLGVPSRHTCQFCPPAMVLTTSLWRGSDNAVVVTSTRLRQIRYYSFEQKLRCTPQQWAHTGPASAPGCITF